MSSTSRPLLANLTLLAATLLICLLLLELTLRLFDRGDNIRITAKLTTFTPHPQADFALKPNILLATYWNGRKIYIKTNPAGRRIPIAPDFAEQRGNPQLICAGDSYVFGNEENAADTFVHLLRQSLDVDTINLGTGSYSTTQSLARLQEYIAANPTHLPRRVLLFFFLGNDFHDNIRPPGAIAVDPDGRLHGEGDSATDLLRRVVFKSHALSFIILRLRIAYLNFQYHRQGSMYAHIYTPQFYTDQIVDSSRRALTQFRDFCAAQNLDLVIVLIPDKDQVYKDFPDPKARTLPNETATSILRDLQVAHIDLLPHMLNYEGEEFLYNMTPAGHLSRQGHRLATQVVAAELAQRDQFNRQTP